MPGYDRPYFENQRDRERSYRDRDRDFPSSRRGYRGRDEDDDRGPWISRDRDEAERGYRDLGHRDDQGEQSESFGRRESDFDRDDEQYGRGRRFEQFEEWERPREIAEFSGHPSRGRRFGFGYGEGSSSSESGYGYGGASRRSASGQSRSGQRRFGGGQYSGGLYGGAGGAGQFGGGQYGQSGGFESSGRYAGRGPKGYQRSDERLKEEVCEMLTADPYIDASELEVSVQGGEVTLEGSVRARQMKRAAEDCVEGISGVRQVHNRLRVESNDADQESASSFSSKSTEGQRSSAGRKAH